MKTRKERTYERGAAMLIALFLVLLLSAVGVGLFYLANSETRINANFRSSERAYLASRAGVQEVRERLVAGSLNPIAPPTGMPGTPGGVIYVLNPSASGGGVEVVDPTDPANAYFDDELCHENYAGLNLENPGGDAPCTSAPTLPGWHITVASQSPGTGTSQALPFKWVRLTLKANNTLAPYYVDGGGDPSRHDRQVCWNGTSEVLLPDGWTRCDLPPPGITQIFKPVYMVTALAKGSRRVVQAEVAFDTPFVSNAAIASQDHVVVNGQLNVSGYDHCSCSCTSQQVKGTTFTTCTDRNGKVCDRSKWAIFSASPIDSPGTNSVVVAGTGDPSGSMPTAQNQPWSYDVPALIARYSSLPEAIDVRKAPYGWTCSGSPLSCGTRSGVTLGVPPNFPPEPAESPAGPPNMVGQITYVPGDLQLTADSKGNGILLVDGDLDIHGGMQFYGLVIVRGVISFTGGGSNKVNLYGAVVSGQESFVDTIFGGSASVNYDFCSLSRAAGPRPPLIISSREILY